MGWQRSSAELTAESQPAPLAGPDETLISSAKTNGNLHDASEQRYQAERWRAPRGFSETTGRPNPEPSCRRPRSTMICCRNTRISASNAARGRNKSTTIPKIILQRSNIPQKIIRFCVSRQLDDIYDRDRSSLMFEAMQSRIWRGC